MLTCVNGKGCVMKGPKASDDDRVIVIDTEIGQSLSTHISFRTTHDLFRLGVTCGSRTLQDCLYCYIMVFHYYGMFPLITVNLVHNTQKTRINPKLHVFF